MIQRISDKEKFHPADGVPAGSRSIEAEGASSADAGSESRPKAVSGLDAAALRRLERRTRRRLRSIEPLTSGKVLGHPRYWTFLFLRHYLDECDEQVFHDPESGYLLAQHAPELARRVEVGNGPERYGSEAEKLSWRVRALAVWGSCCRAFGDLTQAALIYRQAFELASGGGHGVEGGNPPRLDSGARGEVHARFAVLCMAQQEFDEASRHTGSALDHFSEAGDSQRLADTLVIRGLIRHFRRDSRGLEDFSHALSLLTKVDRRSERTLLCALENTLLILLECPPTSAQQALLGLVLRQLRTRLSKKPKSRVKVYISWVEGLNFARLGMNRVARTRLERARAGFLEIREVFDFCVVSIDLACVRLEDGAVEEARALLAETHRVAKSLSSDVSVARLLDKGLLRGVSFQDLRRARLRIGGPRRGVEGSTSWIA
ncbi:MAG: hypothetical protein MI919_25655 [Holophagales bacterium]|nr:hypothetical protein [Holophagales bacterium]